MLILHLSLGVYRLTHLHLQQLVAPLEVEVKPSQDEDGALVTNECEAACEEIH